MIKLKFEINKVKIVVMVPFENVDKVRNAICSEGGGTIGEYSFCSISTKCIGTFKPSSNAKPYIGEKEKLEYCEEIKLEVMCDINIVKTVLKKIREVHPYEEPGIDIIPLIDQDLFN